MDTFNIAIYGSLPEFGIRCFCYNKPLRIEKHIGMKFIRYDLYQNSWCIPTFW